MRRNLAWIWLAGMVLLTGALTMEFGSSDRTLFVPGEMTSGHYQIEVSCESCHTPWGGVEDAACLNCHQSELQIAEDSHPRSKFTDPRNADRLALLDARSCVTCHVEHRPEITNAMAVTLPDDYCFYCHSALAADIAEERPSHKGMAFETCASSGCHNFHDNRALYEDFLIGNAGMPDHLTPARVQPRAEVDPARALGLGDHDWPDVSDPQILGEWATTAHARSGVNCSGCHLPRTGFPSGSGAVDIEVCASCHAGESGGFMAGKHGMRMAANLEPMSPAQARLPMRSETADRKLDCVACHPAHTFDTRSAAVDACLGCHADDHSLAYVSSPHFALWEAELDGMGAPGSGVSCATCHLPRAPWREGGTTAVRVVHNQNDNLRPNEKMVRSVCMSCHGLGFSIDALADSRLIRSNFDGLPERHVPSIDMAVDRALATQQRRNQ